VAFVWDAFRCVRDALRVAALSGDVYVLGYSAGAKLGARVACDAARVSAGQLRIRALAAGCSLLADAQATPVCEGALGGGRPPPLLLFQAANDVDVRARARRRFRSFSVAVFVVNEHAPTQLTQLTRCAPPPCAGAVLHVRRVLCAHGRLRERLGGALQPLRPLPHALGRHARAAHERAVPAQQRRRRQQQRRH
jgi:hypothetical protein